MPVPNNEASPPSQPNKWAPYANPGDFTANMVITIAVLLFGLLLGLVIKAAIGFFLCVRRRRGHTDDPEKQAGASNEGTSLPTLVFLTAGSELIGAECAICLADFVEGDGIRVLPACNHGFHAQCVDRWLAVRPSCPTCRVSYSVTPAPS